MGIDPLVVDENSRLVPDGVCRVPAAPGQRAAGWRKAKAFELNVRLRELRAASHIIEVCLARLLHVLSLSGPGFRRWGCVSFEQHITQELRQPSSRRFRYLVAIDEAIVSRPLVKLGEAWRRGRVSVSVARRADPGDDCLRVQTCAPRTDATIPTTPTRGGEEVDAWYSSFCSDRPGVVEAMLSPSGHHRPVTFHAPPETCRQWDLTLAHCRSRLAGPATAAARHGGLVAPGDWRRACQAVS